MKTKNLFTSAILVLLTVQVYAQTGPGGVGTTNNILWLDAELNSFNNGFTQATNGQTVEQWNDQSGNGNNLTQTAAGNRPQFTTNQINGHSAIVFDGSSDFISGSVGSGNITQYQTFVVGEFSTAVQGANDNDVLYIFGKSSNANDRGALVRTASNHPTGSNQYLGFFEGQTLSGPAVSNSYHLFNQRITNTSPRHFLRIDGSNSTVSASTKNLNTSKHLHLGIFNYSSGLHHLTGGIAEMIVYDAPIDTTEQFILENYLASKYNLTIGNDLYAHDAAHGNEVTGIGRQNATDLHTDARGSGIVQINSANDLEDGEYLLWGHDNLGLGNNGTEVPAAYVATAGLRLNQEWRVDISGGDNTVGTVTIIFDLTGDAFGVDPADYSILIDTDNDGDFANASVNPAMPSVAGGVITFTGVTLIDGNYFTIGNSQDIDDCFTLTGGDWDAATTIWDCGSNPGPDSTNNITISDGHSITVLGGDVASANDLTLEADGGSGGGSLILDDGATLIVKGNLVLDNSASITFNDDAVLILRGINGNQAFTNNSGATLTMTNLQLNNDDGATMSGTDQFELSNGLSLTNGNLTNNSTFTFLSDATSTATLSKISNGALIDGAGTNIVQRFRGARDANWGDIGSSGVDTDLEDLNGEVLMSGIVGGNGSASNAGGGGGAFVSVYTWNATTDVYVPAANTSEAMTPGVGFEIWLADNLTVWGAQTWELQGDINTSTTALTVNSNTWADWSLVANPFNGFLDWDAITTASGKIDNDDYWYLDADLNTYTSVSAGGGATVPPGQGFWIQTTTITSLSLNPTTALAAGVNTSTFLKRKSQAEETMIHVRNNNEPFGSAVYLRKDEMAFDGFDNRDISPLRVPDARSCRLSIETGAEQLMVNYVPGESEVMEIPMTFEPGLDGDYTFSFDGLDHFSEYSCVSIRNEESGEVQQSLDNSSIITIDNVRSDDAIEYTLIFSKGEFEDCQIASNTEQTEGNINVWNTSDRIIIDYLLDQTVMSNVFVQNSLGQTVWSGSSVASYNRQEISTEALPTGLYVVSVHINGNVQSKKLIIQ